MITEHHILSLGAGVQSTTLYLMFLRGEIQPPLRCAIFADTGDEPKAVYEHLRWLQSLNGPPIWIRSKGRLSEHLSRGTNSTGQRFASIPAFTTIGNGEHGRTRRQCSKEYKIEVIDRTIRREVCGLLPRRTVPRSITVHQYFGISLDESSRASRIYERFATGETRFQPHFPLIEKRMTRADCKAWLKDKVPHETPRSACVYCPFHSDAEWLAVKAVPEDWALALKVDAALRTPGAVVNRQMDQTMYLHRSCQPLTQIEFKPRREKAETQVPMGFALECMGVCGV